MAEAVEAAVAPVQARTEQPAQSAMTLKSGAPVEVVPGNFAEVWKIANAIAHADLLPPKMRGKVADCAILIMAGRDLNLSFTQALRGIHVFDGRIALSAQLMAALALGSGKCERYEVVRHTDEECEVHAWRVGNPQPFKGRFTYAEAQQIIVKAGPGGRLCDKDNWKNYRPDLLLARAQARAFRKCVPDVLYGLYDIDEVEDLAPADVRVVRTPSKSRTIDSALAEEDAPSGGVPSPAESAAEPSQPEEQATEPPSPVELKDMTLDQVVAVARREVSPERFAELVKKHGAKQGVLGFGVGTDGQAALRLDLIGEVEINRTLGGR